MSKSPDLSAGYRELLVAIRAEIASGIREAARLLEQQKVRTYWSVGRLINSYLTTAPLERGDIGAFYRDLSRDLDLCDRTLQQCEQFFRFFPERVPVYDELKWSHYRYLLVVPEEKDRTRWIKNICREKWAANDFRVRLADALGLSGAEAAPVDPGQPARGTLYTYRLVRGEADGWLVDIGFTNRIEAPVCDGRLDNKYLVNSVKDGAGTYRLKLSRAGVDRLYTYQGRVIRVIDGDTLAVLIDQGFGVWTEQKLRLKGLDAPEIDTLAGKKSKFRVEELLAKVSLVVVRTARSDKYDRYLADIFFLEGEGDAQRVADSGRWLNGELLSQGLASVWKL